MRICANFYGNSSRNKKVTCFDSKLAFLKEIPLLMLTNQNKALFIILFNESIVHQNEAKFKKFQWKRVLGTAVRLNIFSNIQLIKKKFGSNIDGHMKEECWNNEACRFIIFKIIIENPPLRNIKNDISATKGSITYKNLLRVYWEI